MNLNNPLRKGIRQKFGEGSALRSNRDSDANSQQWKKGREQQAQSTSYSQSLSVIQGQLGRLRRRIVGGGAVSEPRWQEPYKELSPDVAVSKGTWVYISPENPIVTVGMTDPIAGSDTKSYPGIWEAAQDVPASTGVDDYNVPQTDYPGATGTPTGTGPNTKGDLDGGDVYWILICPTCGL